MSLAKIIEQIKQVKPLVNEDVDAGPVETLNARRGRQRAAVETMARLTESYSRELLQSAFFILVTGSATKEFADIAQENFPVFAANADGFYDELVNRVPPALYEGKESVSSIFDVLGRHLEDKANELGVIEYPQLIFKQEYNKTIKSKADFSSLVKRAINSQVGGEFAGIHAVRSIVDKAIEKDHAAKTTAILMTTDDEKLVAELSESLRRLSPRVAVLAVGKTSKELKDSANVATSAKLTKDSVEGILTKLRDSTRN